MWLRLKQRKMFVKFSRLWVLTIIKEYRMRNTKGLFFGRVIGIIIQYNYLLNQVSLFSNSSNLSVAWKDFTATQSLTPVRDCVRIFPMSYQCCEVLTIIF